MVQASTRTNPFPGLRPFELDEEHLFFGREGQADELLVRLNRTRFLGVVGTSGSGKSSLVRAGLLPSLYSGFLADASSGWRVAILRPGSSPMRNLAEALNDPEVFGEDPASDEAVIRTALTESTLRRGALGLVEVTNQAQMQTHENLLVVVDQFEEIFRFKQQAKSLAAEDEAAAFVKLLLAAAKQREVPIFVVLTMRSDFLGDCAQFRDLPEALNESQYLIPRLTRGQLRRAIEGPVAVGGAEMTPQLVNRLLNDVGDNPDQLPILQHALMRTWDHWEDQAIPQAPIDIEHYEAVGGMATALSRHADQIYDQLPDDRARYIAEILFKRLTDRGADNREIRRPTQLGEICAVADAELEKVVVVIDAFRAPRRSFLMPPARVELTETSVIDISHESLMRNWLKLKDWVEQEDRSATIYRRLSETAALHQQDRANYLRDPELTIGLTWLRERKPNAVWAERYAPNFDETIAFLRASADACDEEALSRIRAKKREINRLRTFLVLLGGLSLLTGGAAVYAFSQQQKAIRQGEVANEQREIAEQLSIKDRQQAEVTLYEKQRAETAQEEAEEQKQQAETAQQAEAEQRQLAEVALQRAEVGEAEANRQTEIAREQTAIANRQTEIAEDNAIQAEAATAAAEREKQRAEVRALNAKIQAESLTVENLIASDLNLKALLRALALGKQIKILRDGVPFQNAQAKGNSKEVNASTTVYPNSIRPEIALQAVSVLREIYYLPSLLEKNTFSGHSDYIYSVSFSPDERTIATTGNISTVKLWDRSGREIRTLADYSGSHSSVNFFYSVSFSPDGRTIAATGDNNTVKLWDLSGRELQTLVGHSGTVRSVSFATDGQTIATGSEDGTVKLWDLSGRELQTLVGHSGTVRSVSFATDGQTIATGSEDGTVKLWDRSGQELQTLVGHSGTFSSVSFSSNGQTIATGSEDGTVKLWDRSGRELQTLDGHSGTVRSVSFATDGQTIATGSEDGTVKLWDRSGRELQTLVGHSGVFDSVSFSPDGQTFVTGSDDNTVKLWNHSGRELQTLDGHSGVINSASFSPDGQTIATGSEDGTVKLWDRSGRELQTLDGHSTRVVSVSFSPDGQTIATASFHNIVKLWDRSGRELQTLVGHSGVINSVSFSPDGQTIATASANFDNTVKLWDLSGRESQVLVGHSGMVSSVSFSPDGQTIATASSDSTVKLWDRSGQELQTLVGHSGGVRSVSFATDGQTIATASSDSTVKLWDRSGQELQTLVGHSGVINSVSFSPDGQTIATASSDSTVKLWDRSGRELQTLQGHSGPVLSVSFSHDGQTIATASGDGTVILWNFDLDNLIARSCDWLKDYMGNPTTPPEEKALCKDVSPPSDFSKAPIHSSLASQLQGFWSGIQDWLRG
ncbi:MAG: hypothetical protein AAF282_15550 [Cyanobacteria bacterium P01_A01_bin.15]